MIIKAQIKNDDGSDLKDIEDGVVTIPDCKFVVDGRSKKLGRFFIVTQKMPDDITSERIKVLLYSEGKAR